MDRRSSILIVLASLAALSAQAQSTKPVDGRLLHAGIDTFVVTYSGTVIGRSISRLVATTEGEVAVWRQDYQFERPEGDRSTDTLVMDAKTLRPIREARASSMGTFAFTFRANEVVGVAAAPGEAPTTRNAPIAGPVFSSASLALVASSLPLKVGMKAIVDFYNPSPSPVEKVATPVLVVGSASVPGPGGVSHSAWVVTVGEPGSTTTLWIDKGDRTVLQFDTEEGNAVIMFRRPN